MTRIRKRSILTLLACCIAIVAMAQEFRFTTQVSSNTVALDEAFQIMFSLENAPNLSQLQPPDFKDFDVLQGPMQSMSTSITNGRRSDVVSLVYILRPKHIGNFTLAGAIARVDGVNKKSNPVTIEVTKASGARNTQPQAQPYQQPVPQTAFPRRSAPREEESPSILRKGEDLNEKLKKNIFVKVDVDKTSVYEGEQITATYKLYTRLNTSSNVTKVPAFKGFSAKDIELPNPPQAGEETVNGLRYKVFTIRKTLLFPLQSGALELDPAEVDNVVRIIKLGQNTRRQQLDDPMFRDVFGNSPFDDPFMDDFFNRPEATYEDVPYKIKSPVVTVNVKPLPIANRPASFSGAVGRFQMTANADKKSLSTDDALTLKVVISGQGNVNLMNAPKVDAPGNFEKFDPKVTDNIEKNSNPLSGSRQYEFIFMPREAGAQTLPAVEFSYFDPKAGEYKVLRSSDFPLQVSAGKNAHRDKEDFSNLGRNDLSNIYPGVKSWVKKTPYLFGQALFWILLLLPLLGYGGMVLYRRQQRYRNTNANILKHKNANKVALKRLELAARYLKEEKDKAFYEETSRAIWGYLSHKLRIPMAELSKQLVQDKLQDKVEESNTAQLFELLDNCEMALYAPVGSSQSRQQTYQQAIEIISKLEDDLKKVMA